MQDKAAAEAKGDGVSEEDELLHDGFEEFSADDMVALGLEIEKEMRSVQERLTSVIPKDGSALSTVLEQADKVQSSQGRVAQMQEDLEQRHDVHDVDAEGGKCDPDIYSQALKRREVASEPIIHAMDDLERDTDELVSQLRAISAAFEPTGSIGKEEDEEFFDAVT